MRGATPEVPATTPSQKRRRFKLRQRQFSDDLALTTEDSTQVGSESRELELERVAREGRAKSETNTSVGSKTLDGGQVEVDEDSRPARSAPP